MQSETASTPEKRTGKRDRRRRGNQHLVYVSVTGVVAIIMIGFLSVYGLSRLNNVVSQVKRQGDELVALRAEQSRASCLQQNDTVVRQRKAFTDSIGIIRPPGPPKPEVEKFIASYIATVNTVLRFRDCTPSGITAYFTHPPAPVPCRPDGQGFCLVDGGTP